MTLRSGVFHSLSIVQSIVRSAVKTLRRAILLRIRLKLVCLTVF